MTCPGPRRGKRSFVTHQVDLPPSDRAVRDGIPVTSLARTILDLAAESRPPTVSRFIQRADDNHDFDLRAMRELLGRTKGHRGHAKVLGVLDVYEETSVFTRSALERCFLALIRAAGLPEPSMNAFVAGHEIDAYWAPQRFGVELDVYGTHGGPLPFEEDRVRDDELLQAGVETTRVTGRRLDRDPGAVVESVRRHLARRAGIK